MIIPFTDRDRGVEGQRGWTEERESVFGIVE